MEEKRHIHLPIKRHLYFIIQDLLCVLNHNCRNVYSL